VLWAGHLRVMQLASDPVALLRQPYMPVAESIGGTPPRSIFESVEEGERDEQCASAADDSWECLLDSTGCITTIFLFGEKGCTFPYGLTYGMSQVEVKARLGVPTSSRSELHDALLGAYGAAARWDKPDYCLHAEFSVDAGGLKMLTFMLPENAPKSP
jgi:hypothetical protein